MNGHSPRSCLVPPSAQRIAFGAGAALLAGLGPVAAQADDLRSALLAAYNTNPSLQSARETQRATDEGVPIARADGLPSANVTAQDTEYVKQSTILSTTGAQRLGSVSGTLNVPLYSGGAVRNAVKAAEIRVDAGKAGLRGTESTVFSTVVGAYMDVILDEAVVRLNRTEVQTLQVNLQATTDRFQIGDLTRTDVAQSQSRLALAQGNLRGAEANLASAREHYIAVVGKAPVCLEPPPPLPGLPTDVDEAVEIALAQNPDLIAARERSRAAKSDVGVAGASRLPRLSLFADSLYGNYFGTLSVIGSGNSGGSLPQSGTTADVGIRATIPLYQGGRPSAEVRQAQAREGAALEDEIGSERSVIDQVRSAFTAWQAANSIIESTQTAVAAATLSLEGVRAENSVGRRTILDILNATQELVSAQQQLATARRNAYVAGFTLLAAMGKAEARDLGLDGGVLYDPDPHYRAARRAIWDWGSDPAPVAHSTRTVDTPAQEGSIPPQ
ncbi:MAG: TolC family outer membrane protein [Pseudomonadota bacterium]|nr:TolC family outer membrane protein [Pseudomonadota bacterium]